MKFTSQYFSLWCHPYCRGGRENFVIRKIMSSEVDSIYFGIKIAFLQWHVAGKSHGGNNIRCHKNDVEYLEYLLEYLFILTALIWSDTGHYFILFINLVVLTWTYTGCWAWQKGCPPPVLPTCVGNWDEDDEDDDEDEEEEDEGPENMKSVQNQSF